MNRIKELREARGMSQGDLGKLLDCAAMTVCRYEREDDRLYPSLVENIARIFGVTPAEVMGWSKAPPLDSLLLAQSIQQAEDWLARQDAHPDAHIRARIIAALYEMALRDRDAGGTGRVDLAPLEPVLRLLLPA